MDVGEKAKTLVKLGLTSNQARAYLALVHLGVATAKEVSKNSQITRQDIYRVMPTIQQIGLIEKIIASPSKFRAIPIKDAVQMLLQLKDKENFELHSAGTVLIEQTKQEKPNPAPSQETQFKLISGKRLIIETRKKGIERAQTSIDILTTWKRFLRLDYVFSEPINRVIQKGVRIRMIICSAKTQIQENKKTLLKTMQNLSVPNYEIKLISTNNPVVAAVQDKKEVCIFSSATAGLGEAPMLWSDNANLVQLTQNYFDTLWNVHPSQRIVEKQN